ARPARGPTGVRGRRRRIATAVRGRPRSGSAGIVSDTRRGLVYGGAVLAGLVALDLALGTAVALSGTYMLAAFVAAVVGDELAAMSVGALTFAAAIGSAAWNDNFGTSGYWARAALV